MDSKVLNGGFSPKNCARKIPGPLIVCMVFDLIPLIQYSKNSKILHPPHKCFRYAEEQALLRRKRSAADPSLRAAAKAPHLTPQGCFCGFAGIADTALETAAERVRIQTWSNGVQNPRTSDVLKMVKTT